MFIPKVFHQVWLGWSTMPNDFIRYQKTWLHFNAWWQIKMWNEKNIYELLYFEESYFNLLENYSEKSDYLRFCIILEHGWIYIDTDMECLKNIEKIIENEEFFIWTDPSLYDNKPTINAAFFGSVKNHSLVKKIFFSFGERIVLLKNKANSFDKIWPNYITKIIRNYEWNIKIFPSVYFSPIHPKYFLNWKYLVNFNLEKSYGIHHYDWHWLPWYLKMKRYIYNFHPIIDTIYSFINTFLRRSK